MRFENDDPTAPSPLRVMFVITSMPVGGAETLLVNLIRRMDRQRFQPELCCLKELGPLGEELCREIPAYDHLLGHKYDVGVWGRLARLFSDRRLDAVVTVGAGDKMFWGRLAAWRARTPVVVSALHSTGWPDSIGWLNRRLTSLTDAFVACATGHGQHLVHGEGFPADKVAVIPNGVDIDRFRRSEQNRLSIRAELDIEENARVAGVVAALRPEKNLQLFLQAAADVHSKLPTARFVIVGDGPERASLEACARSLGVAEAVRFAGSRPDVPALLSAMDVFSLTSLNEANPVSILEAMATELPVVATDVGSISESVGNGVTGYLVPSGDAGALARRWLQFLGDPNLAAGMGATARRRVKAHWSLDAMVNGYETLLERILAAKRPERKLPKAASPHEEAELPEPAGV